MTINFRDFQMRRTGISIECDLCKRREKLLQRCALIFFIFLSPLKLKLHIYHDRKPCLPITRVFFVYVIAGTKNKFFFCYIQ